MSETYEEAIDSQFLVDNVGFLDNCFDNSFTLQNSLIAVKQYIAEEQESTDLRKNELKTLKKLNTTTQNKTGSLDSTSSNLRLNLLSGSSQHVKKVNRNLKEWGLPYNIAKKYEEKGISDMFDWQVTCLSNSKVLSEGCNLVYSAPTSAGKTLVAEILTIKTVLERQKKVIIILPFVSIVREKMFYLQDILSSSGIRVEGFMGSQSPPGGLQAVHVAICTIEKANSLINRLLDDNSISDLGAVIVDELHLLGDSHRGYILELLLTKVKYVSSKLDDCHIQVVGMSATLPNLEVLATWLDAELFITQFRPIPLDEYCLIGSKYFDKHGNCVSAGDNGKSVNSENDNVLNICLDTIRDGCSVLIFCMTKNRCECLAQSISSSFFKLGCSGEQSGLMLRKQLNSEKILEVLEQLKNSPVGLDQILKNTISFGVAYHHAGLTFDERDIVEGGFKSGAIRVLVATSTLSSGVNLPARKVIIRTPVFRRQPINILTYKQMIGRAGRMGKDTKGESVLICTEAEKKVGFDLMMGTLDPVKSCIENEDKYMRAILEMIASEMACTKSELDLYSKYTLLYTQENITPSQSSLLEDTLKELRNYELVRVQNCEEEEKYVATPLGKACLSSSMAPNDGLSLFCELQRARQCLVLETDLHLIYLVTPYSVSSQWGEIDWLHLLTLWESLTKAMKRVGELVGVHESFIIRCLRGTNKLGNAENKLNIHKRFYTALALQDLVNEVPLSEVSAKFQCARGFLQGLQQSAATFAGMVTSFCHQLGWRNMELLISQFQDRLHFGIHSELLELMKLPSLNGTRARTLYDAGFETISSIASADVNTIENALYKGVPFQSEKGRDDEDPSDIRQRNRVKNIWVTGHCALTTKEAAENFILEARKYLEYEIGVSEIKWNTKAREVTPSQNTNLNVNNIVDTAKDKPSNNSLLPVAQNFKEEDIKRNITRSHISEQNHIGNPVKNLTKTVIEDKKEILDSNAGVNLSNNTPNKTCTFKKDLPLECEVFGLTKEEIKAVEKHKESDRHMLNDCKNLAAKDGVDQSFYDGLVQNTSRNSGSALINIVEVLQTNNVNSPSILKDDHIWDTLNLTEAALDNIIKDDNSHNLNKPNKSYSKHEISRLAKKDLSLVNDSSQRTYEKNKEISRHVLYDLESLVKKEVVDKSFCNDIVENVSCNINFVPSHKVVKINEDNNHIQLKDDTVWDTLNLTEVPLDNIISDVYSDNKNKPSISCDIINSRRYFTNYVDSKSVSAKDISLFSSEGDNSSLFEESLPLDSIRSKIYSEKFTKNEIYQHFDRDTLNSNCNNSDTAFDSFEATTIEINDEEDIKLVYGDENKDFDDEIISDASDDIEVLSTLEVSLTHRKSPFKRLAETNNNPPLAKKSKMAVLSTPYLKTPHVKPIVTINSVNSKSFQLQIDRNNIICYILTENDVLDNLHVLASLNEVSIYLNVKNDTGSANELIGRNILKTSVSKNYANFDTSSINGITLYNGHSTCLYLDLTTLNQNLCLVKSKLSKWFESKCPKVNMMSFKMNYMHLKQYFGVDFPADCFDVSLAEWLIDTDERIPDIIYLIRKYCGLDLATVSFKISNTIKKFTKLDKVESYYIKAWSICKIAKEQHKQLIESYQNFQSIINTEIQVLKILATCEYYGICVDKDLAAQFLIDVRNSQDILQKKAYKICGYHFNFNSSKDVAKVLGMYKRRKVSTKKSVLRLCNSPMSNIIMYWRKLSSILTKTLYPLTEKASFNRSSDRIKPTYNIYTCTGRVSMHVPNLQNIPRTFSIPAQYLTLNENPEIAGDIIEFNCRNIFRAASGHVLISADYCQLEMRILTHYSGDIVLTNIMKSDMDVFKSIAASWAGVTEDEVDDDLRQKAKQLCYGILYGMGNKTLSQHLEVSEMEAAVFTDTFYKTYPAIRVLTQKIIEECRRKGYVETFMKRRRYLPEINSSVVSKKNAAERQAVNTTIQGSAADIAKAAMCAIDNRTNGENKPRLILQMHDELIYEVSESQKDSFISVIKEVMETTVVLNVPLPVKVRFGHTWGTLNEVKI